LSGARQGGVSVMVLVVSLVLFMVAIYSFNQGLNSLQSPGNDQAAETNAILYLSITVVAFALVALTVLRVRRGYSAGGVLSPKVLSVVRCTQCSFKQIKSFSMGDYVFKAEGRCSQCGNDSLFINGIYAEDLRKRPSGLMG